MGAILFIFVHYVWVQLPCLVAVTLPHTRLKLAVPRLPPAAIFLSRGGVSGTGSVPMLVPLRCFDLSCIALARYVYLCAWAHKCVYAYAYAFYGLLTRRWVRCVNQQPGPVVTLAPGPVCLPGAGVRFVNQAPGPACQPNAGSGLPGPVLTMVSRRKRIRLWNRSRNGSKAKLFRLWNRSGNGFKAKPVSTLGPFLQRFRSEIYFDFGTIAVTVSNRRPFLQWYRFCNGFKAKSYRLWNRSCNGFVPKPISSVEPLLPRF